MKVSLILTSFNSKDLLKSTLENIEKQDYSKIEVVIKDGGSTDGTVDVIKEYKEKSKHQVKYVSEKDTGIYDAMNQGYKLSTGDIIAFFNDRFISKNVISKMVKTIIENPGVVGAHGDLVYKDGEKIVRYWKMGKQKSLYLGWMPGHPTLFLKREIYEKYGLYDTSFKIAADYEFMIRFLKDKNNKLAYLPKVVVNMYYGGTSTATKLSYIDSLKEGHRALVKNGIHPAFIIDGLRTIRVLLQFVFKPKEKENY